ncbi:lipoprotein signal peptidase [Fulvivirgaceae bacterium PWU5]|uniref:Lipoprotein signal peptidase n=1 Tax=Dawidia cretensis TaxID=2782350 RepID=A0AAP2GUN5_9BACT|nr:lipoprotein signal peptidase [Dawidia cretensis]MBT1709768.1 lipoprotein signal peptidase [Dawidia cretensis]
MKIYKYFILAVVVILIDQASKLLVHHHMDLHEEITILGGERFGFKLHYLLNPGMAFGIRWNNEFGKLALTVFRILAMGGIAYYLWKMAQRHAHTGFLWCMALILGGAVGNVIDSTFYGVWFNNHPVDSPTPWFHGQVIDMLFFPLFDLTWPKWVPVVGGEYFLFFSPVFNIADSSIFVGVVVILLFQRRFFGEHIGDTVPPELHTTHTDTQEPSSKETIEKPADSTSSSR